MKRSMWMFSLALLMSTTAAVFAANSPFHSRAGGCNSVCARDSNCTDPQCPFCEPIMKPGAKGSAMCRAF